MQNEIQGRRALLICDRLGWPVTTFKGRPILNFIRYVLHGRKLKYWWKLDKGGCYPISWVDTKTGTLKWNAFAPAQQEPTSS